MKNAPTVVSFAAPSGTGKTTLLCKVVEGLKARGYRVGAIKGDAHGVELDTPGKDTHRLRSAGSETTALVSRDQIAIFRDRAADRVPLAEIVTAFFDDHDFVLAEGFRSHGLPTVVIQRSGVSIEGWKWPDDVIAIASDLETDQARWLDLNDTAAIVRFVEEQRAASP